MLDWIQGRSGGASLRWMGGYILYFQNLTFSALTGLFKLQGQSIMAKTDGGLQIFVHDHQSSTTQRTLWTREYYNLALEVPPIIYSLS